jgi:putative redox protein
MSRKGAIDMTKEQEVAVRLLDGMHFEGWAYPPGEGVSIQLDAKGEVGGQGLGARPQSLLLVSLCGCSGMDVLSILRKKRQQVTGLEVRARAERAETHPQVYTRIELSFVVEGEALKPAAIERSIELSMTKYCPVAAMLQGVVPIETRYEIVEPTPA